jgi:hypothetical protein
LVKILRKGSLLLVGDLEKGRGGRGAAGAALVREREVGRKK